MFVFPTGSRSGGFSLVELSVVLMLVSLLVGGIMAGLNIRHSAELKSITDEVTQLRESVGGFGERYHTLPGDMYNATTFWGAADADANNCKTKSSTDARTCNGDGNGMITTPGDGATYYEAHRFWQHMVNAQLLEGRYSGHRAGTGTDATCLSNAHCGVSDYKNGIYYPATIRDVEDYFIGSGLPGLETFPGDKGHVLVLFRNSSQGAGGALVGTPLLTAEDAYNIDLKFDNSLPATGYIQTFKPVSGANYLDNDCATTADETTARYNLSSSGSQCALIFTNVF